MKEALIIFVIALVFGSVLNSIIQFEQAEQTESPESESAFVFAATDKNFQQEVLKADEPVLVDFWAPWCAPCRRLAPVIAKIAEKYAGQIKVVKINTDQCPETSQRYKINAIPHLFIFRDGKALDDIEGAASQSAIESMIKKSYTRSSSAL